ncbi:uncharacterized protein TNCV_4689531 [Trichonephila clavipes]|nr:uncharacterized protein TNCV_4689531 [Trichonephila clavipes]
MAPHKPRKSSSIQDTDDEDMIVYDMAEQIESPKKNDKYFLSEEYWKNESWRQGGFLHVITPTRVRNNQKRCRGNSCLTKRRKSDGRSVAQTFVFWLLAGSTCEDLMTSFISWNCRGLRTRLDDLKSLLSTHQPACVALQETFPEEYHDNRVRGYNYYYDGM